MPIIELDMLIAFVNRADKLHTVASEIFDRIARGNLKKVAVPTSAYMEYELVLKSKGYNEDKVRGDIKSFRSIRNLGEIPLTSHVIIKASKLRIEYGLSYFDSLHAASAFFHDKTVISVDKAYGKIPEIKALDPRCIAAT